MSYKETKTIKPNPPADFQPERQPFTPLSPFRYWCQKVLPLVYDDSLSYYELLCKVVDYLNKTMEDVTNFNTDMTSLYESYEQLQEYVNNYFSSLDVQTEINNKLDSMASDGTLSKLIQPLFDEYKEQIDSDIAQFKETTNSTIDDFKNTTNQTVNTQNSKIDVLEGRMNEFTKLPEGSTSGDAELADIRVWWNGNKSETAGVAVRKQIEAALKGSGKIFWEEIDSPYDDFNTVPVNQIVTYGNLSINGKNYPEGVIRGTLLNFGYSQTAINNGNVQLFITPDLKLYQRMYYANRWREWVSFLDLTAYNKDKKLTVKSQDKYVTGSDAPFDDFNTISYNTVVTYTSQLSGIKNCPDISYGSVLTLNGVPSSSGGIFQIVIGVDGKLAFRIKWGDIWREWNLLDIKDIYEKINNIKAFTPENFYASISMFEKISVVGDSYASGEIVLNGLSNDKYNLSWIQNIARMCGVSAVNFSSGGLTTETWLTHPKGLSLMKSTDPQNLYFLALGINDYSRGGSEYLGTPEDMKANFLENPNTFYGNYGKIIGEIKNHAPNAKLIIMTIARKGNGSDVVDSYNSAIKNIAMHFSIPCINQLDDSFFNSAFYKAMVEGHPVATTYSGMALAIMRLFSKCCIEYKSYFDDYVG